MKVLIACEYSGTVRDAFIAKGHDAIIRTMYPEKKEPSPILQKLVELDEKRCDRAIKKYRERLKEMAKQKL